MAKVQSPIIGNALRTALDLDAAGGMPMLADDTIVPVAIVADVRELLTTKYIPVMQAGEQTGAAGVQSYTAISWDLGNLPKAKRILLDALEIVPNNTSAYYFGFSPGGWPGTQFGLPRRKVASLSSSNVTGRVVSDTSVDLPTTRIPSIMGAGATLANTPVRIVFAEPIILDAESQAFVVGLSTPNVTLRTTWEWREERA